jgi:UDP-N-acetylglucosamine:LPS N-acetylglucosamine transferase
MSQQPVVDFMFFDAGGGHRSAATALDAVIKNQQRPWNVRLVNFQEVMEPLDVFKKVTGIRLEDIYNLMLAKGWTIGSHYGIQLIHAVSWMIHGSQVKFMAKHLEATKPDMVVSVVPNFNRVMYEALRKANPKTPYVTILTDMADYPPHFWIERNQDQWFICGTDRAVKQAQEMGYPRERIYATSGMILRPKFYDPIDVDRAVERRKLGLDPALPTGVVLFGGQGSSVMIDIAHRLGRNGQKLQLIFICGRNESLAARLRAMKLDIPVHVVGFTSEVPYFMHLSDFLIGKPGPGSISEALHMRLPVVIERNAWTLAQEIYNAEWVTEKQVGIVLKNFTAIESAMKQLLAPGVLEKYRANASAIQNRAVFEIPDILAEIATKTGAF